MLARLRRRLTFANIVAVIALFFAMGGVAYAAGIDGHSIIKHTTPGNRLIDNTVTGAQVREGSLGKVPKAHQADNSATVAGRTVRTFSKVIATNTTTPQTIISFAGLTLDVACDAGGEPTVRADAFVNGSLLRGTWTAGGNTSGLWGTSDSTGTPVQVFDGPTNFRGTAAGAYLTQAGHVVTFELSIDDNNTIGDFDGCSVSGSLVSG